MRDRPLRDKVLDILESTQEYVSNKTTEEWRGERLIDLACVLEDIKTNIDNLKLATTLLNTFKKLISEHVIPEVMEEEGITKVGIDGVGLLHVKTGIHATILKNEEGDLDERALQFLKDGGHGGIVKEKVAVHHMSLSSVILDKIKGGEEIPDQIKVTYYSQAVINKVTATKKGK